MNKTNIPCLINADTYFDENSIYANYYHFENLKDPNLRLIKKDINNPQKV
jgi:hypothetical protein